ncbi:MAG: hypothetical protein DRR42_20580 [Gammaproteobacteria bacterium]|nr:MAG: hypothetical protein DRR42_20580 [Gammaproteobacteria bacterium]
MSDLAQRIQYLEDLEAIRYLKHYYYCHCVDRKVAGDTAAIDETVSRFTDDIVADFTGLPLAEGREAVIDFYVQGVSSILSWCQHRVMNDVIDISGDTATGLWYVDVPCVFRVGNSTGVEGSGFINGRYQEEYVRDHGVWKWKRITALLDTQTSFVDNWTNVKYVNTNR